jgi:two-component sensor histidine kinase
MEIPTVHHQNLTGSSETIVSDCDSNMSLFLKEPDLLDVLAASPFGVHIYERSGDGKLLFLGGNLTASLLLGQDRRMAVGMAIDEVFPALGNKITHHDDNTERLAKGQSRDLELHILHTAGAREIEMHVVPIGPLRVAAYFRDISEQKKAERQLKSIIREKEVLLKEIHHRVKNNLQVISSLLSLQSAHADDQRTVELFRESQNRVKSMALVHERLYRSENMIEVDFGEYVRTVVVQLARSYGTGHVNCFVDADDVHLSVDAAIPCGLIVNELVSNALKHAFPGQDAGQIHVSLRALPNARMELSVKDTGIGFPEGDFRTYTTMGMMLVTSLTEQLGGTVDLERNNGSQFIVRFPAPSSDRQRSEFPSEPRLAP